MKNHSEDDTFLVLSRPSLDEMMAIYKDFCSNRSIPVDSVKSLFEKNQWTFEEYLTKMKELYADD